MLSLGLQFNLPRDRIDKQRDTTLAAIEIAKPNEAFVDWEKVRNSIQSSEGRNLLYQGVFYASRSEAACAALLSRYIPDFLPELGKSYEVPIGINSQRAIFYADFYIRPELLSARREHGVFIEFHQPWLSRSPLSSGRFDYGDFGTRKAYVDFIDEMRDAPTEGKREEIIDRTTKELLHKYGMERRKILERHPDYHNCALIVVGSAEDLYEKVLMRFLSPEVLPSRRSFEVMFEAIKTHVVDLTLEIEATKVA